MIAPVGVALMEHAAFKAGERVVDIGCGAGGTTVEIGRAVGPTGEALGIDISPVLAEEGARRAAEAGLANTRFLHGDAAEVRPEGAPFDRLFSRFGSMFFLDPQAAFTNLHDMLRPGGRADLGVWQAPRENQWFATISSILARYVELPATPPRTPGPFAFADPDYMRSVLAAAGFHDTEITPWRGDQLVGGPGRNGASAAEFLMKTMSVGEVVKNQSAERRVQVQEELAEALAPYETSEGVRMGAAAWIVTSYA
jgi:ubiquinone/menaquinone biosynthesis C-methylase UbiE